jgi:hypothetical protein
VSASVWAEVGRVLVGWPMTYRSENNLRETVVDDQRSEQWKAAKMRSDNAIRGN